MKSVARGETNLVFCFAINSKDSYARHTGNMQYTQYILYLESLALENKEKTVQNGTGGSCRFAQIERIRYSRSVMANNIYIYMNKYILYIYRRKAKRRTNQGKIAMKPNGLIKKS